ncbi:MAG: hypothetical protein OEZ08_05070 [Betaproteobacteria bacterium]|nr:hypothetical protein [Betaproteobacteria bacterium]
MTPADLKALQTPLLVLAIVVLLAAGGIYYTDLMLDRARLRLAGQQEQLKSAEVQLRRSGEEKRVIETFLGGYQQLAQTGFIGEEQRINWLDGLRVANQRTDLFGVDYEITVQRRYPFASELNPGALQLNESLMRLRFRLLHEGDLMRFFGTLAQTNVGVFAINACNLRRIDTGGVIRVEPHVTATCELSWITAKPSAASERKP